MFILASARKRAVLMLIAFWSLGIDGYAAKRECSSNREEFNLAARVEQCQKNFVDPSAIAIGECFSSVANLYPKATQWCQDYVKPKIRNFSVSLLGSYSSRISDNGDTTPIDLGIVSSFVGLFQKWYQEVGQIIYRDGSDPQTDADFSSDFKQMENSFWSAVNQKSVKTIAKDTMWSTERS